MKLSAGAGVLAGIVVLTILPHLAREARPAPDFGVTKKPEPPNHFVTGELMGTSGGELEIRPYNLELPRRIRVTTGEQTRFMRERGLGKARDIQRWDMVAVLLEKPPRRPGGFFGAPVPTPAQPTASGSPSTADPSAPATPQATAVIRLWQTRDTEVTPDDVATGHALIRAGRPLLAKTYKSHDPELHTDLVVGVVTALNPYAVQTTGKAREFELDPEAKVVNAEKITLRDLRRHQSLAVQSMSGLTAEGTVAADLVIVAPPPHLPGRQIRKILLRDQGRKHGPADIGD